MRTQANLYQFGLFGTRPCSCPSAQAKTAGTYIAERRPKWTEALYGLIVMVEDAGATAPAAETRGEGERSIVAAISPHARRIKAV